MNRSSRRTVENSDGRGRSELAWSLLGAAGAFRLGRRLTRGAVPALTYHRVLPDGPWTAGPDRHPNVLSVSEFERHIAHLRSRYHVASGDEFLAFLGGHRLPPGSVLITFDDGYRDNYEHAFPVLRSYAVPALFFVVTRFVGTRGNRLWLDRLDALASGAGEPRLAQWAAARGLPVGLCQADELRSHAKRQTRADREAMLADLEQAFGRLSPPTEAHEPLTWEELGVMADAGMTIGSHTATHQILGAATEAELQDELHASRLDVERRLKICCWALSYPNGEPRDFGPAAIRVARDAGYACAFTQVAGFIRERSNAYALPRIPVPASDNVHVFLSRLTGVHALLSRAGGQAA